MGNIEEVPESQYSREYSEPTIDYNVKSHFHISGMPSTGDGRFRSKTFVDICEYLDTLHTGTRLLDPVETRWPAVHIVNQCGSALHLLMESLRTAIYAELDSVHWTLKRLEQDELPKWNDSFRAAQIAVVSAVGYLDFRFPNENWRTLYPYLAAWSMEACKRPSVLATMHK